MKKFLPLLAASFFLASCQLIPSKSSQGSVSPSSSSPASSEVVATQEEEVKDDVAQNALLDSTIGMSMLSQNLVPNLSSRVKRAGLLDNFKPNIASIFASQVDNFQFICSLDTASFKTVQSDREEYASLFEAPIDLGEENLTMTAQLYYNLTVSPDLSQGLRIDLNGIAAIKEEDMMELQMPTADGKDFFTLVGKPLSISRQPGEAVMRFQIEPTKDIENMLVSRITHLRRLRY